MSEYDFSIENQRFHLTRTDMLVIYGWYRGDNPDGRSLEFYLDGSRLKYESEKKKGVEIRQKYMRYHADINEELTFWIPMPDGWERASRLKVVCVHGSGRTTVRSYSMGRLKKLQQTVDYYLESEHFQEGKLTISGWAMGAEPVSYELTDVGGNELKYERKHYFRKDVAALYAEAPGDYQAGFQIIADAEEMTDFILKMKSSGRISIYRNSVSRIKKGKTSTSLSAPRMLEKITSYYRRNGMRATARRMKTKLLKQPEQTYQLWRKEHLIIPQELEAQRSRKFSYEPFFSIVIPLYRTPKKYLCEMIESVQAQTYGNWELCLADGSEDGSLTPILEKYKSSDPRIRFETLPENLGISENTNAAIQMATREYIVFADHDDIMPPEALYECAKALNEDRTIDMLYSDEDKVDMDGRSYFEPNFKPDFNPDLLCSMNYICHLCVVKRELLERAGTLRRAYDGAQDYDFILRCTEKASHIFHIPKVLYHWRCHLNSTAANPESKLYAFEAGKNAIGEHYRRMGIPAEVEHSMYYGMYHTIYRWKEQPLVSILIPNKDHSGDLKKCMTSILQKSTYRNFEFIIIENNSTEEETFAAYKELETEHDQVHVVYYKGDFNFSRINNFGASHANGDYFLLLNNDTEIVNPDTLWELLGYCMREDVGAVGAKLNYEDDTIQHAGVVIGFGGTAGHTFIGLSRYDLGYQGRIVCAQDYSAVTAACMMTKRSVFEEVGGLTEELQVAFNDIDYCMKVRAAGKLVVYNPYAELYHYESKSRGMEDTPEKVARFNREAEVFQKRWMEILEKGDPYFNPNLTLDKADFSLK